MYVHHQFSLVLVVRSPTRQCVIASARWVSEMILATAGVWETVAVKTIFDIKVHFPVTQEVYQGEMARARMLIASPHVYILDTNT
jgi:hypothetical protein